MLPLSLAELAETTEGVLRVGALPPLGGSWEPVCGVTSELTEVRRGDVMWSGLVDGGEHPLAAQAAMARGALGVVSTAPLAPWAGSFTLQVTSTTDALRRAVAAIRGRMLGRVLLVVGEGQAPRAATALSRELTALIENKLITAVDGLPACLALFQLAGEEPLVMVAVERLTAAGADWLADALRPDALLAAGAVEAEQALRLVTRLPADGLLAIDASRVDPEPWRTMGSLPQLVLGGRPRDAWRVVGSDGAVSPARLHVGSATMQREQTTTTELTAWAVARWLGLDEREIDDRRSRRQAHGAGHRP